MKIAIGADHRGFALKNYLMSYGSLSNIPIEWVDCGTFTADRTDYPIYAKSVAHMVQNGSVDSGILACGTGTGMAIAANRYKGIYAAVVWSPEIACASKEDDNINILVFPADYLGPDEALTIVTRWLVCSFKHDHYAERLDMIDE